MKLVTAETLAAALHKVEWLHAPEADCPTDTDQQAAAILAAIPPDPRLDALLAAAREMTSGRFSSGGYGEAQAYVALRDALAAFEDKP